MGTKCRPRGFEGMFEAHDVVLVSGSPLGQGKHYVNEMSSLRYKNERVCVSIELAVMSEVLLTRL